MRVAASVVVCLLVSGCAARQVQDIAPGAEIDIPGVDLGKTFPAESLEAFMAKVKTLASEARPGRTSARTIEGNDRRLAAALFVSTATPSPAAFRQVAREYKRLGIFDDAYEYLNKALRLDRHDAATHDDLARLWRDSGFPHLALGDAHRALFVAPNSPIVRNTVGTILQVLGQRAEARAQYEIALQLDPSAEYALNNLCYGWILDGDAPKAAHACQHALRLNPDLAIASNNLGIAYAAAGNVSAALSAFAHAGDTALGMYNLGVVHLARRRYVEAAAAFKEAQRARPSRHTAARLRQAEALSRGGGTQ